MEQVNALVRRQAPWQEMADLMESAAPSGFVIYLKTEVDRLMSLAGDDTSCTSYLMGNHIIAERMFRHEPAVILYARCIRLSGGPSPGPRTSPLTNRAINSAALAMLRSQRWASNSTASLRPCSFTWASQYPMGY